MFNDGELFRVSTATARCTATNYRAGQRGFTTFGMGYATDQGGPSETLFVAAGNAVEGTSGPGLGKIAAGAGQLALTEVGAFLPRLTRAELTGTGDGRLFAFYASGASGSAVAQVDKSNAHVVAQTELPGIDLGQAWAFAFWGGDFWLFTAPGSETQVTQYHLRDGRSEVVGTLPALVVGAGVSTCAPQQ